MTYTTQGLMTAADIRDHELLTDTGTATVDIDDLGLTPEQLADACPECGDALGDHGFVIIHRASGDIVACDA